MLLNYQVISTFGQLNAADLGFFGDIHSEGYPSFDWLGTDFANFGPEDSARLPLVTREDKEVETKKFSNNDKIVKRHNSQVKKTEDKIFNPSKYYYPKTNVKQEENAILEPVLKKIYEDRKEDIYIPVYKNHGMNWCWNHKKISKIFLDTEKTSLYEIHGIPELPEETTSSNSYEYSNSPPLGGSQHEDGQQYTLDEYVDGRGKSFIKTPLA